ncbi:MAG: Holliday junction branch migration protein RuvA [Candidatus Hydrogenedentes bacterium]|nr:Holliday junction branch migration protein RuvA [Candidatus Hydrogenedentota bacterium]
MFAFLRGTVAIKSLDHIALDVGGAGYEIAVPETVYRKLAVHQEVTLLTYCHIREDAFQIFGFLKEEEKTLFTTLLSINKVGPKVALNVLSGLSVQAFGQAVLENDVKAFTKIPGVGQAMAQRIVLEMKTKLKQNPDLNAIIGEPEKAEAAPEGDDAYEALISLGCTPAEAKKATAAARKQLGEGATDEDVVRAALRSLAKV